MVINNLTEAHILNVKTSMERFYNSSLNANSMNVALLRNVKV